MTAVINKFIRKEDRPAFIFIMIAGTLNHFLYEWTNNGLIALFCPVNESVWEHLKLLFFPFLFWIVGACKYKKPDTSSYFYYRIFAVLCGMLSIIVLFYTYTGIIGRNFLVLDILIFVIGTLITLRIIPKLTKYSLFVPPVTVIYTTWMGLVLFFFLFTSFPPNIPLFFPYS